MEFDEIIMQLLLIAKDYLGINKIILFGSYAKNKNNKYSDIDIAISGNFDYFGFVERVETEIETLKSFDIVEYDAIVSEAFKEEIDKYGKILYQV